MLLHFHRRQFGLGRQFAVDAGIAVHLPKWMMMFDEADFHFELIAWHYAPPKSHLVDSVSIKRLRRVPIIPSARIAADCASASTINTPGITGRDGKVAGKEGLVDGHVLERQDALAVQLEDPIDQQKRIPMRQQADKAIEIGLLVASSRLKSLEMFIRHSARCSRSYFDMVDRPSSDGAGAGARGGGVRQPKVRSRARTEFAASW